MGGVNIRPQIKALKRNPQVIIGTPGRLKDLFEQRALRLNHVSVVVIVSPWCSGVSIRN